MNRRDGAIIVGATGVSGPLTWGFTEDTPSNTFFNAATCLVGSTAKFCSLGDFGTAERIMPPPLCTLYVRDSLGECSAHIPGCVPGSRAACLTQVGDDAVFQGCNLHVRNNGGATGGTPDGLGNLFVGWNEHETFEVQTGSNNLIIGSNHQFSSYGGLVAGQHNKITDKYASVTGGQDNWANGEYSSISSGLSNTTIGLGAVVSGGEANNSSARATAVGGGASDTASGNCAFVGGGTQAIAGAETSAVFGGACNHAFADNSVVVGGFSGQTLMGGVASVVVGGAGNETSGFASVITGGSANTTTGSYSSVSGGLARTAAGQND